MRAGSCATILPNTRPFRPAPRQMVTAAAQAIGVIPVYNRNVLAPADAPKSWLDLLDPRFADHQIAIQNAAAGTQFNQFYLLERALGLDFIKRLAARHPVVMPTGAQMTDAIVRGEVQIGASLDHWRAFGPTAEQAGLTAVYPTEGMPLTLAPVGIIAGAPHPNAAKLFMDFILSSEGTNAIGYRSLWHVFDARRCAATRWAKAAGRDAPASPDRS